jgi:tRNA(Ile)-lysidine synthase
MILIAYSGGVDSSVLLHQLAHTQPLDQLRAIHINHALYPEADHWQAHCEAICQSLGIPLICIQLKEAPPQGASIEAWARDQRHAIFAAHLQPGDILMTAQHADDQAETLLLQLIRGAGPKGLSGMPAEKPLGEGRLQRPLLSWNKEKILAYAQAHQLSWITDHSNQDLTFDRNYLRQGVIPLLKDRWPGLEQTLSRSAAHCAEQESLIKHLLAPLYQGVQGSAPGTLSIEALLANPPGVQRALVRHWLAEQGFPLPSRDKFEKIFENVIPARPDAQPLLVWGGQCIRRYRDNLYALPYEPSVRRSQASGRTQKKRFQSKGIPPWER